MKKCIVDTAVIRRNAEILKSLAGGSEIWAVVKGDGYGLGLGAMAGLLYDCGIRRFAVSEPSEAERLRALPRQHIRAARPAQGTRSRLRFGMEDAAGHQGGAVQHRLL